MPHITKTKTKQNLTLHKCNLKTVCYSNNYYNNNN